MLSPDGVMHRCLPYTQRRWTRRPNSSCAARHEDAIRIRVKTHFQSAILPTLVGYGLQWFVRFTEQFRLTSIKGMHRCEIVRKARFPAVRHRHGVTSERLSRLVRNIEWLLMFWGVIVWHRRVWTQ